MVIKRCTRCAAAACRAMSSALISRIRSVTEITPFSSFTSAACLMLVLRRMISSSARIRSVIFFISVFCCKSCRRVLNKKVSRCTSIWRRLTSIFLQSFFSVYNFPDSKKDGHRPHNKARNYPPACSSPAGRNHLVRKLRYEASSPPLPACFASRSIRS